MKKESDENLKTLKKEFNEKMKGRHNEEENNAHSERSENVEESEGEIDLNDSSEKQEKAAGSSTKKTPDARTTFITEVNLTYEQANGSRMSPDLASARSMPRNANVMKIKALEKELQDVKKENRDLRKKLELARTAKKFADGRGKEKSEDEKKTVNEIKALLAKIEVMKVKEKQMLEQMSIMKEVIKDHERKHELKCQEFEDWKQTPREEVRDKSMTELIDEVTRLKQQEAEMLKEIAQYKVQLEKKEEENNELNNQIQTVQTRLESRERIHEEKIFEIRELQEEVQTLQENKMATNERMRQFAGHVRVNAETQTYPSTKDAETNTENCIFNVIGRSLKQEERPEEYSLSKFRQKRKRVQVNKLSDTGTTARITPFQVPNDTLTTKNTAQFIESNTDIYFDSDFISGKLWTAEDEEEYRRNIRSMEESLEICLPNAAASQESSVQVPALSAQFSTVSKESTAKVSCTDEDHLQVNELGLVNTVELDGPFRFPNISSSPGQKVQSCVESSDVRSSIEVKLPDIPKQVPANNGTTREEKGKKMKLKKEQVPSKIGVLMKEGGEACWKPITEMDLSPQKCSSSPMFSSPLKQSFGKRHSDQDGVKKDIKLRAATKKKNQKSKKEFRLTPRKL